MKKIAFALITIFSLFVISCEIGLGASVDTDAPSLEILNPPVDSVIRDTFALTGTWADDGNIADVTVTLRRTDINGESQNIKGTLAGDIRLGGSGTWSAEIVPVAEDGTKQIPDGSYQATVTIKDTVGRTTIRNTTFKVIGVLKAKGANMMGRDEDDVVITPWTTLRMRVNRALARLRENEKLRRLYFKS